MRMRRRSGPSSARAERGDAAAKTDAATPRVKLRRVEAGEVVASRGLVTSRKSADGADGRPMLARSSALDKPSDGNLQPGWRGVECLNSWISLVAVREPEFRRGSGSTFAARRARRLPELAHDRLLFHSPLSQKARRIVRADWRPRVIEERLKR